MVGKPHYLLFCDSRLSTPSFGMGADDTPMGLGRWQFVLERLDGPERLEAFDTEPQVHRDRIALLAVVRGLEAVEQASRVKLVTTSRYVDRGLRFGLSNWRESDYQWESFGSFKPIRNADLWERIDIAMQYHELECRLLSAGSELVHSLLKKPHLGESIPPKNRRHVVTMDREPGLAKPRVDASPSLVRHAKRQWWEMATTWVQSLNGPCCGPATAFGA